MLMGVVLMAALLMMACSSAEDIDEADKPVQLVVAHLNFSLPSRIVGKTKVQPTRMGGDVVQADGEDGDFRGLDDIHLLCFNEVPTASSNKVGSVIEMNTKSNDVTDEVTEEDYSLSKEIDVPVGTTHFGFYASAEEEAVTGMTEHERLMHYGTIEAVGIDKRSYQGNSAVRFKPVPICKSNDKLGGSATGQALLNLLNYLMNIQVTSVQAPNNRWATANNLYLNEAFQRMTQLKALSSYHVQVMLGAVLKILNQPEGDNQVNKFPDGQGRELAAAIIKKIEESCNPESVIDKVNGVIVLKDSYQGYPEDIHLPAGAARIAWDADESCFKAAEQDYGKGLSVPSVNDYVYPMSLQYQVFSDIVASDELVINNVNEEGEVVPPESPKYDTWSDLLAEGYGADAEKEVQATTRSVAMVKQVEYAVGRLALRARLATSDNYYDAKGKPVDVSAGFTLKGYIVGGQHEVDYDFRPIADSHVYAIYDTDIEEGAKPVVRRVFTDTDEFDYILGLGSLPDAPIYIAMELENNGPDFWGADGVIAHGATFYLVAELDPLQGTNYASGSIDQIFIKDRFTKVNLQIAGGYQDKDGDGKPDPDTDPETGQPKPVNGLATATYGLPDLEVPHPTVGLSVDLSWGEGLWFDDVEL